MKGVLVIDLQVDFLECEKGSLVVPGTDKEYVERVERLTQKFKEMGHLIFATQDWHPPHHVSFYTNHPGKKPFEVIEIEGRKQVLWPPHCIQGTRGARILIDNNLFWAVIQKGRDRRFESYSGFRDEGGNWTELDTVLKVNGIKTLIIYGLATDYCVKATALDARDLGYEVLLLKDFCRGVSSETTEKALKELKEKGVKIIEGVTLDSIFDALS